MIFILCALFCEASDLISKTKATNIHGKKFYQNNNLIIIICGVGKAKAQGKLQEAIAFFGTPKFIFGLGISAASSKHFEHAQLYAISEVFDMQSQRLFKPKPIDDFALAKLRTYTHPVLTPPKSTDGEFLIDMESSALFESIDEKRIVIVRVVSDFCDAPKLSKKYVVSIMSRHAREILKLIQRLENE